MLSSRNDYLCEEDVTVMALDYEEAFKGLSEKEKMYMYYLYKAIAAGWRITAVQTSVESPYIISLIIRIFREESADELKKRLLENAIATEKQIDAFLIYVFNVLGNMGNYRGFGDTKMIPRATKLDFECILHHTVAYEKDPEALNNLWNHCCEKIFSQEPNELRLGLGDSGVNSYYSRNITVADIKLVQDYCDSKNMQCYNNRLFKHPDDTLELRMASVHTHEAQSIPFQGRTIELTTGDYSPILSVVVRYLQKAQEYAANETEVKYLQEYIDSFNDGDLQHHITGSSLWTQDKKPTVENYIGFIENYRDPYGVRGEWEGFVAIMNKKYTKILSDLVDQAPRFLALLPWGSAFEKPVFLKPDFTSIDIVGFFGSGIPAGINIPNYDEVRQSVGFKNVSLGNIINGKRPESEKTNFIAEEDQAIFRRGSEAFEVQVGLHELLGHGSGVLFVESRDENGNVHTNIPEGLTHPILGGAINSWYKEGETWSSVFNTLANTYEECRAECVGLYLSTFPEVLHVFGYDGTACEEMMYLNWLHQLHMSLVSLQAYNTEHHTWTQSHCCARHVYLQVLLRHTQDFVTIEPIHEEGKMVDFILRIDRSKIISEGRRAIGDFLKKLQIYKSTADYEHGEAFFNQYTNVDNTFLEYRDIVLNKKKPRAVFMQPELQLENGEVISKPSDISISGVIEATVHILGDEISEEDFLSCIYKEESSVF